MFPSQFPSPEDYYGRLLALAEAHPEDEAAVDALVWIVATSTSGYDAFKERGVRIKRAMDILASDHLNDPRVGRVCLELTRAATPLRDGFLQAIYARSNDRRNKGRACLALGEFLLAKSEMVSLLKGPPGEEMMRRVRAESPHRLPYYEQLLREDPGALARQGEQLLERAIAEYGDLPYDPTYLSKVDKTLAEVARDDLRRLRSLAVGQEAPEIDGRDVHGNRIKLSDHRGKVVALVFWGSWCAPCMEQVPHERELVERLKGRRFALLGIACDESEDVALRAMERERMDWPSWYDGAPGEGPIAGRYLIQGFPSVFVLDARGVIRAKDVRGEGLDQAVDELMKELEQPTQDKTPHDPTAKKP